jgi:hypothetical protein
MAKTAAAVGQLERREIAPVRCGDLARFAPSFFVFLVRANEDSSVAPLRQEGADPRGDMARPPPSISY